MKIGRVPAPSVLVTIAAALGSTPLVAATTTGSIAVSVTVEDTCFVDARPMIFGAPTADNDVTEAQSFIVLRCTPAASYLVTMDEGRHGAGGGRRMADGAGTRFLTYEIYRDAARTRRWDATVHGAVTAEPPASGHVELAVYGRLAAREMQAGSYDDMVTVTVSF